jgi:zona occludens toxin (predicted ATPase)
MNEEIILQTLKEIRDDQKLIVEKVTRLDREMEITRNGYTPHQIVEMYHWIDNQKTKETKHNEAIRKAVINWIIPIMMTGLLLGLLQYIK